MKTPSFSRSPDAILQKRTEYLCFLEQAVVVLLSQATRYLIDPAVQPHDKLQLKKELANELVRINHMTMIISQQQDGLDKVTHTHFVFSGVFLRS